MPPSDVPTHVERSGGVLGDVPTWAATDGPGTPHDIVCAELEPGTMVADTFRIEGRLGAGAMGVVYRAHHLKLDRLVALKVHRAGGPNDALRLEREARAMARLTRIEGETVAIKAFGQARVALRKTTHAGSITRGAGGAVVELPDD